MDANILEILKQMQRDLVDQKNNIRKLHEKLNLIEEKITDLQHDVKNKTVASKNVKNEKNSEDSINSEERKHKKNMENSEVIELQNSPDVIIIEDTEMKYEDGGKTIIKEEIDQIPTCSTLNYNKTTDANQSEIKVKKTLKEVPKKLPIKKTSTSKVRKQKTVGSQTCLKSDQIKKHKNKQNNKAIIEEHPVMKKLRQGVVYKTLGLNTTYHFKLGINGLKAAYFKKLLEEYPDLSLLEAIQEWLRSLGPSGLQITRLLACCDTNKPLTYKDGKLVPLD